MQDCYKILGVSPTASLSEIKRAYRQKAKQFHPDLATSEESANEFQNLVQAYEILADQKQREIFDSSYNVYYRYTNTNKSEQTFDYRTWLSNRNDDESKSKLIFFDLMHNREDDAVELFVKMNKSKAKFLLSRWFTRENFMDYGFILCEELVIRSEYYDAILLLEQIIQMEYTYAYFRLFFPEVVKLAKDILRKHIFGIVPDELALDTYERALDLGFGKHEDAFYLEKIAQLYFSMGDVQSAKICVTEALKLDSKVVLSSSINNLF